MANDSRFFSSTYGLVLLAILLPASLFINLGGVPLFDEDEGAYAEVTREMLENHDLVTPRLNGRPFFHKPPMIYWTQAACVRVLGLNEYALRLPSAIAAFFWALALFLFVNRFHGRQAAWFSVFFLVTALQTNLISKAALADTLLNLFITGTLFSVIVYHQTGRRLFLMAAYLSMGLGFLTKGPIAVAIPAAATVLFYASKKRFRDLLGIIIQPVGWLLFLAVTLPWYVALYVHHGSDFIQEFFFVHNVGRFLRPMEGHSGSIFFYIPVILLGLLPYTTVFIVSFSEIKKQWQDDQGRFLLMWFLFVFVFFSLAGTKLHHYVVYGYIPLFIFMAVSVSKVKNRILLILPVLLFCVFLWLVPFIAGLAMNHTDDAFARLVITDAIGEFGTGYALVVGLALVAIIVTAYLKHVPNTYRMVAFGLVLTCLVNFYLVPKIGGILQGPIKSAALMAKQKQYNVVMWKMNYPSFNVYYGRQVEKRTPRDGDVIITKANKLKKISSYDVLFQKYGIVLAKINVFKSVPTTAYVK